MRRVISITTDFGQENGFVGVMKGVIWGIAPDAHIADITHNIPPQNIRLGAYALWRVVPYFPPDSVHIAVVDPGVGTDRRPMGLRIERQYFIVPDNGLITPILEDAEANGESVEIVHLNNPDYWLPEVSRTFHGRDIFAPTGAHLARGVPLTELGDRMTDPFMIDFSRPVKTKQGWEAHITIIDVFGNLTTDLPAKFIAGKSDVTFRIQNRTINGIVHSYGHENQGDLIALVDSENYIEICVVNGSAAVETGAQIGDILEVIIHE